MDNPLIYLPGAVVLLALGRFVFQIGKWVGNVNTDRANFKSFMDEVKADLREIRSGVWTLLGKPTPVKGNSPLTLTDYGEDIAQAVDARLWTSQQVDDLKAGAIGKRPYEVEEIAFSHAQKAELSPLMRDAMWEHDYSVEHVRDVLGVVLRDELIRQNEVVMAVTVP